MPGYQTHIATSTTCGVALVVGTHYFGNMPWSLALMGGGLCSVGGILPDIDSKTSTAFQRVLAIVAGFSALMLVSRLRDFQLTPESVILIGGGAFIITWMCFGTILNKFTRHRGMCHSIPMGIIAAEIVYILSSGTNEERLFKGFAVFSGVMIHLLLDEFYSIQITGRKGKAIIKKSLGTALKMIDFDNIRATVICFLILGILTDIAINEPVWSASLGEKADGNRAVHGKEVIDQVKEEFPKQFDIAVVEWVAENKMVLNPGESNNQKWKELTALFDSPAPEEESRVASQSSSVTPQNRTASLTAPDRGTVKDAGENRQGQKKISFLEQINISNRASRSSDQQPTQ